MADIRVSDKLIKLVGQNLYSASPIFPVTVRELLQNSIDAQRNKGEDAPIVFSIFLNSQTRQASLTCKDVGIGMDAETINSKFLVIGESGKQDGVGGFGIAKAAIILSCDDWELHTRNNKLSGGGVTVNDRQSADYYDGCEISLKYNNPNNNRLYPGSFTYNEALHYLVSSNVPSKLHIKNLYSDGTEVEKEIVVSGLTTTPKTMLEKFEINGSLVEIHCVPAIKHENFSLYQNSLYTYDDKISNRIIYRLNGLTQFTSYGYGSAEFNIVVDITTTARPDSENYPFTLSREELNSEIQSQLNRKIRDYFTNAQTTVIKLKEASGEKIKFHQLYDGYLHSGESSKKDKTQALLETQHTNDMVHQETVARAITPKIVEKVTSVINAQSKINNIEVEDLLEMSPFGIKTFVERTSKTLKYNITTNKHNKILQIWTELIALIMTAEPTYQHSFGVGLILDQDFAAMRRVHEDTTYYLINPLDLKVSDPMATVMRIFFSACHEVAHTHYRNHDESFVIAHGHLVDSFLKVYGMKALYEMSRTLRSN